MPLRFHCRLQLRLPILLLLLLAAAPATEHQLLASAEEAQPITLEGCPDKCGETSIPFPFGMTPGCFRPGFQVVCDHSFLPSRAFLDGTYQDHITRVKNYTNAAPIISEQVWGREVELMDVSAGKSEARVYAAVSSRCIRNIRNDKKFVFKLQRTYLGKEGPFLLSAIRNVLVGVGASVEASMGGSVSEMKKTPYKPSCLSDISDDLQSATNGSCASAAGCCVVDLRPVSAPPLINFGVRFGSRSVPSRNKTTPCSYAMVVENSWYNFSTPDLYGYEGLSRRLDRGVPVTIEFAIRNSSGCPADGQQRPADHACVSGNSSCHNADRGRGGYVCRCWENYQGNPYIANGCQDINECEMGKQSPELSLMYPCFGICKNTVGGYDCRCKRGMKGDAKKGNCTEIFPLVAKVILGFAAFVVVCVLMVMSRQQLKLNRFYDQNGGPALKGVKNIRIYKRRQLKKLTDNYKHVIGEGHFGKVYMGILEDKQKVAIKVSIKIDKGMKEEFIKEVIIQSGMRHKNIVMLLGCCLEVSVPMLVYEHVARGSLYDVMFGSTKVDSISVHTRLEIAVGSARVLTYMHSETESTIRHGDVKSANILLDKNFTPKVSDFGTTRLLARGKAEKTDNVIGDLSYIDPVYMDDGVVTQKSDVYSFGVILIELITTSPAVYDDQRRYVGNFVQACLDKQARSFVDKAVTSEADIKLLEMVSEVAVECLKPNIEERLDMKQVEHRLNQIIGQSSQSGQEANYQADLSHAPDDIPMLKNCENEAPRY